MAVNIFMFRRLMKQLKLFDTGTYSGIRRYSLPPLVFMIFFLAGYLFVIFSILTSLNFMGILLVGLIFFFGAVFVLITTKFQTETVAHLQESQIRLKHEALHDPLTELPNRRLILDRLSQAIERSLRKTGTFYSVMFIDLDRFKIVNDSLGHTTGDELLVEVGKRLVACVRGFDTVSRFGGDE
ncbi:MAG: GGDEF domain-containing protein, partial [Proteobacteria bacterium]|nr:GGDEF domain-containing protein [Pseudomonadota bacterium]